MKIVNYFKKKGVPVICFPKGLKNNYKKFNDVVSPDGLNIDYEIDPIWARENLFNTCLQGGMHPKILLGDKKVIINETEIVIRKVGINLIGNFLFLKEKSDILHFF